MNKKEEKTNELILAALERLLEKKSYTDISVSDIILESTVSRSTFYAHYKKKDDVLRNVCTSIFNHAFSSNHTKEGNIALYDYREMTAHIFYHFKEQEKLISAIFASGASHLFYSTLGKEVHHLMRVAMPSIKIKHPNIPDDILENCLSGAFVDLLKDYVIHEHKESAIEMTTYFYSLFE